MGENTKISWCDDTFNAWIGCTKISCACDHCYAERYASVRLKLVQWGSGQPRYRTSETNWNMPRKWNRAHDKFFAEHGRRRRVFTNSLADVFDNEVDPQWRADLFDLIRETPNIDWLVLTKRIGIAPSWFAMWGDIPSNVWLGISVVNQDEADRDIPKLLAIPARVRFLSCEPMLGRIDLAYSCFNGADSFGSLEGLHWVIAGGESGPHARPMHPDWVRSLRDQCVAANVAFHFKQWGEFAPNERTFADVEASVRKLVIVPIDEKIYPAAAMDRVGKETAGRLLDGRSWDEFPKVKG